MCARLSSVCRKQNGNNFTSWTSTRTRSSGLGLGQVRKIIYYNIAIGIGIAIAIGLSNYWCYTYWPKLASTGVAKYTTACRITVQNIHEIPQWNVSRPPR